MVINPIGGDFYIYRDIDSVDWLSVVSSFGSILMYFLLCCILFEWFCYVHSYRLQHTITKNSLFVQSLYITSVCSQLGMVYLFCRWHTVNRAVFLLLPFRQNVDNPHIKKTSKIIFKIPSTFSASFPLYREMKICLLIPAFNHVLSTAQIAWLIIYFTK